MNMQLLSYPDSCTLFIPTPSPPKITPSPSTYNAAMRRKLGLTKLDEGADDAQLAADLLTVMADTGADWTNTWRRLARFPTAGDAAGGGGGAAGAAAVATASGGGGGGAAGETRLCWLEFFCRIQLNSIHCTTEQVRQPMVAPPLATPLLPVTHPRRTAPSCRPCLTTWRAWMR